MTRAVSRKWSEQRPDCSQHGPNEERTKEWHIEQLLQLQNGSVERIKRGRWRQTRESEPIDTFLTPPEELVWGGRRP